MPNVPGVGGRGGSEKGQGARTSGASELWLGSVCLSALA